VVTRGFALSLAGVVGDDVGVSVINPTQVRTELGAEEQGALTAEVYDEGEVSEPEEVAAAIVFAAGHDAPNMISEMGFYRRDAFADMF
jgi:NADP-dependent 3-hydroxy acid dehydrogenase YdfG